MSHVNAKSTGSLQIVDETQGTLICTAASLADTFMTRLFGLLGRRGLEPGTGLLIRPSSGVHTFGMSFPIDIVALGRQDDVIGVYANTGAWTIRGLSLRTRSVLELPAGRIHDCGIQVGDRLIMQSSKHS